jgi:hypothetical protein
MTDKSIVGPTYLFHEDCPKGEIFNGKEVEARLKDGWTDSPPEMDIPEDTGLSIDDVKNATPDDVIDAVRAMGFIVLTTEQLKAEANKMASVIMDFDNFDDDTIAAEYNRRFGDTVEDAEEVEEDPVERLKAQFNEDPDSLNKDELISLGNLCYSVGLRSNMKISTMIAKITNAMNEG